MGLLRLTRHEEAMLDGAQGIARQKAMERLVRFGHAVEAERMVKIRTAHIFCDWKAFISIGAWPLYEEFVGYEARLAVPTTVENAFITEDQVDRGGMPWDYKPALPSREVWQRVEQVWQDLERVRIGRDDLRGIYQTLRQEDEGEIQGAALGCPLLTIQEMREIEGLLNGRRVKVPLWLYCDSIAWDAAKRLGLVDEIEATGARLVHSTCPGMALRDPNLIRGDLFATDSLKTVKLFSGMFLPRWWFGQRKDVVEAAVSGRARCTRWS